MNTTAITVLSAAVISLVCEYVPGVRPWYDNHTPQQKASIMAVVLFIVTAAIFLFSCLKWAGDLGLPVAECNQGGLLQMVSLYILALAANQGTYQVTKRRDDETAGA